MTSHSGSKSLPSQETLGVTSPRRWGSGEAVGRGVLSFKVRGRIEVCLGTPFFSFAPKFT